MCGLDDFAHNLMARYQVREKLRKFSVEFGLTPSSRSRIRVPASGEAMDEFDRFLETG